MKIIKKTSTDSDTLGIRCYEGLFRVYVYAHEFLHDLKHEQFSHYQEVVMTVIKLSYFNILRPVGDKKSRQLHIQEHYSELIL